MTACACPPGEVEFCPTHGRKMVGRVRELCAGACPPDRPCAADYLAKFRAHVLGGLPAPARPPLDPFRGTECGWRGADARGPDGRALTRDCALG